MEMFFRDTVVPLMPWAVGLTAVLAFILMPLITSILNGKISVKMIIGLVALLVLIFIIYTISPGEGWAMFDTAKYAKDGITETILPQLGGIKLMKYVETCISSTLLLLGIAVALWVLLEIFNFFGRLV